MKTDMGDHIKVTVPKLVAAFLAVYFIWGSTYLAITVAIESLPPLWMVLLAWIWKGGDRPDWRVWAGIGIGLLGIGLLVGPDALGAGKVDALGAVTVLGGALAWATGSIYSRSAELSKSPLLATGMEMLAAVALITVQGARPAKASEEPKLSLPIGQATPSRVASR